MKRIITLLLISCGCQLVSAQCIADAGNDTLICLEADITSFTLGGSPTAFDGTAPYTYTWECTYVSGPFVYSAEDFLDDIHAANPHIMGMVDDVITFSVWVEDAEGNTCVDSISVTGCSYVINLEVKFVYIPAGDTTGIYTSALSSCSPMSYHWTPEYHISDPGAQVPEVWPDTTTVYIVEITDVGGCTFEDAFTVYVYPLGIKDPDALQASFSPNPAHHFARFTLLEIPSQEMTLYLINTMGQTMYTHTVVDKITEIPVSDLPAGVYLLTVSSQHAYIYTQLVEIQ